MLQETVHIIFVTTFRTTKTITGIQVSKELINLQGRISYIYHWFDVDFV